MGRAFNSFLSWTIVLLNVGLPATFLQGETVFFFLNAYYTYGTTSPLALKREVNEAILRKDGKQVDNTNLKRV